MTKLGGRLRTARRGGWAALLLTGTALAGAGLPADRLATPNGDILIHPINHATLALQWQKLTVLVDPVGGATRLAHLPKPDLILLTHAHGDHLNSETLKAVATDATRIVAPPAVLDQLPAPLRPRTIVVTNGQKAEVAGVGIEAVAMYNTTPERLKFHPKGQGNGYVLTITDRRLYVSGDTEDIPELRALKGIDVAFVCMNLPYTMTPEQAAAAVRAFRPKIVYPYHCRGTDLEKFRRLVGEGDGIEVRLRDWYQP